MATTPYQNILKRVLSERMDLNKNYSLRTMADHLSINSGALSQIMSGKRVPSLRTAQKIVDALELDPDERDRFLYSLAQVHRSRGLKRINPYLRNFTKTNKPKPLTVDLFQAMASWYTVAIIELTFLDDFVSDAEWIAKRLGITLVQAQTAIDRLLALEILQWKTLATRKVLVKRDESLMTMDREMTSSALRRFQAQMIEKSRLSLENDPIDKRSNTSMTMAIDPELMPLAKQQIEDFVQELCAFLESGKRREVYNLNVNLVPLTEGASE